MSAAPILLGPADAERYWRLRERMLLDTPWAFASSPEEDVTRDPAGFIARICEDCNDILAIENADGELVASAGVRRLPHRKMGHRAHIWGVYAAPETRGRGFGEAVVRAAVETARGWEGVDSVGLSVSENAPEALRLYEKIGFTRWGIEPTALRLADTCYDEIHLVLLF